MADRDRRGAVPGPVRQFEAGTSWTGAIPEIVAIIVMVTVLLFVRAQFADMVDPALLSAWLAYMALCVVARAATILLSLAAILSPPVKIRVGQAITLAFCIGIMASIWILMPPADDLLRMLMILLCMWFIAMVIVLNAGLVSVIGALGVVASMAAFVVTHRIPYAAALAGFLVMEGAALVMIRRAISRAADKLQAALALVQAERDARTRFIASASHDLQQPLQAAQLYFEHILASDQPGVRDRAIVGVRAAFTSTGALLQSMLDHLRLEAGAMPVRAAPVRIDALLPAIAAEHDAAVRAAAMRLRTRAAPITLAIDEHLLRRILGNLIANALRHSRGSRVLIVARRHEAQVEIRVIDDGVGVPATDAGRLFEDYYQGTADTAAAGGFGIGLASARRMAELMGGTLTLSGETRRGCTFVLRFPCTM